MTNSMSDEIKNSDEFKELENSLVKLIKKFSGIKNSEKDSLKEFPHSQRLSDITVSKSNVSDNIIIRQQDDIIIIDNRDQLTNLVIQLREMF